MKKLFIVESPNKVKTIIKGKYLPDDFNIIASVGHIRELGTKRTIGVNLKSGNFETEYSISEGKDDIVKKIKEEAKESDIIYLATDPDREGEAISWHLKEIIGDKKTYKRVKFNEITKETIKKEIESAKEIDMNMVNSALARQVIDKVVGYTVSPILNKVMIGYNNVSAGRCQSPALKLLVDKQKEIDNFISQEYWTINGKFKFGNEIIEAEILIKDKFFINSKETADKIIDEINKYKNDVKIFSIDKKENIKNALPPYRTSTLQQDASSILGMSLDECMKKAQNLFEDALITYHRTDSCRTNGDMLKNLRNYILNEFGDDYLPEKTLFYKSGKNAQEAHEAIRTIKIDFDFDKIETDKKNKELYEMILRRFVSSQMNPAKTESQNIKISLGENKFMFSTNGQRILFDGYLSIWKYNKVKDNILPDLKVQQPYLHSDLSVRE